MIRRLTVTAAAVGCVGALLVPVATASSAAAGQGCASVSPLKLSAFTSRRDLGSNSSLTIWRDPIKSTYWWESRQLQLTLVKSDLSSVALDARSNGFPGATDPTELVNPPGEAAPIAMINGDFFDMFDTGDSSPHGPVVTGGQLIYAPYTKSFIAGQTVTVLPADEIQRGSGVAKFGRITVPVKIVNGRTVPLTQAAVYDKRWTGGARLPKAAVVLITRDGAVTRILTNTAAPAPTGSMKVVALPHALASSVARVHVGAHLQLSFTPSDGSSDKPRTIYGMESTRAKLTGELKVGTLSIPIGALNYHNVAGSTAGAFDTHWSMRQLPRASATVVVSNGRISGVYRSGSRAVPAPGATVLQLPAQIARLATRVHVGDAATLKYGLKTDSGSTFTEALGHGNHMLRDGQISASCTWSAETVRPRTALGWDDQGHIFMLTATSGRKDGYGGYRTGGATQNEMAVWMKAMGATNAVNFDGGGSTILMTQKNGVYQRVDLPANAWRRPVPDALALVPRT